MATHVFGLTGGIGSGKSSVARRFRARGLPCIDADELARAIVAPDAPAFADIVQEFGPGVVGADGTLNRLALAELVFANEPLRARLNAITHPRIRDLTQTRIAEYASAGEPLVCYEVPLLIESGMTEAFRPLVVVAAPETLQIARTVARDGVTEEHARARVLTQMPLAEKTKVADYIIENTGPLEVTLARADQVLDAICVRLGVPPSRYPRV